MNTFLHIIETILIMILLFYIVLMWLPAFITLRSSYKYYKKTYNLLHSKAYVLTDSDKFLTFRPKSEQDNYNFSQEIIYFKDSTGLKGDIKLANGGYIHRDTVILWSDPYTMYWYFKIKKEILINSSIENMRDNTLSKLGI